MITNADREDGVEVSQDHARSSGTVTSGQSHAPGPWTVEHYGDGDSLVIHSDGRTRVCFMATPGSSPRAFPMIEANARLIVAAPALLAALKEILADSLPQSSTEEIARAAIAKAEGRA